MLVYPFVHVFIVYCLILHDLLEHDPTKNAGGKWRTSLEFPERKKRLLVTAGWVEASLNANQRLVYFCGKPGKPNLAISSNKIPQILVSPFDIRSLKRTVCTWKWLIGRRSFPLGARPIIRCELLVLGSVIHLPGVYTVSVSIHIIRTFCIRLLAASSGELGSPQTFSTTKSPVLLRFQGTAIPAPPGDGKRMDYLQRKFLLISHEVG